MWFYWITFSRFRVTVRTFLFFFFFQVSVCPGGTHVSALSQDPRTFQNTGTWPQNKHLPSAWFINHSAPDRTHKRTYKKHHIRARTKALPLTRDEEKFTWKNATCKKKKKKKRCARGKCVHTEMRYENAYRGGRNSFDVVRMVEKKQNNGWQRKRERGSWITPKGTMETTGPDQQKGEGGVDGRQEKRWWQWRKSGSKSGKGWEERRRRKGGRSKHWLWMNAIFFFSPSPHLPPVLLLLWAREQEALHHPDRQRKRREGERKRDCDGGIKGYPSLSVTSFIVPCSVLPAHPSSAVTYTHTKK